MMRYLWNRIPYAAQRMIRTFPPVARLRTAASQKRWRGLDFNTIYDAEYFAFVEKTTGPAAVLLSDSIYASCRPKFALDVGCGTGALLAALRERGVKVVGFELAEAGRAACKRRGIEVYSFDAANDAPRAIAGVDLVISMAVGHAIPENRADHYLDLLVFYWPGFIVFAADPPGGGDRMAWNEKPQQWWIEKFKARGYRMDMDTTRRWQRDWREQKVSHWLYENVMLLRRQKMEQRRAP